MHIYANEICHIFVVNVKLEIIFKKNEFSHCAYWRQKLEYGVGSGTHTP